MNCSSENTPGERVWIGWTTRNMAEDLLHAAACYTGGHDLMWKLWNLAGGLGNSTAHLKLIENALSRR